MHTGRSIARSMWSFPTFGWTDLVRGSIEILSQWPSYKVRDTLPLIPILKSSIRPHVMYPIFDSSSPSYQLFTQHLSHGADEPSSTTNVLAEVRCWLRDQGLRRQASRSIEEPVSVEGIKSEGTNGDQK